LSSGSDRRRGSAQRLPHGRHGLSRAFVVSNQRERIIHSLAHVCAQRGYRAVSVEDIIAHAGVSRRTFYDLFSDKQQCFLVAYELVMDRVYAAAEDAYGTGEQAWPQRVASALKAVLDQFAAEPMFARLAMVEVLAAGQTALERRNTELKRFEGFFAPGRLSLPIPMPNQELLGRAVVGGLADALYVRIRAGDARRLPEIRADVVYCALLPFLGHEQAVTVSRKPA
jgi:AcrR family transcriptional regulator